MAIDREFVSIIFVQPVFGAEPHEPVAVLKNTLNETLGESLVQ